MMQGVTNRLTALGFQPDGTVTEEPQPVGGGAIFMGDTVSEDFYKKWCSLQRAVNSRSIDEIAEEAAYTWFNRLVAIRIMVKNGLIAPVLQYESEGILVPLLVSEARQGRIPAMRAEERRNLDEIITDDSKTDEQFRILIVAFCHDTPIINSCFGHISDYTELLLPTNILAEGGFVDMLNNTPFITNDDFKSPELIGWLYQFYIAEKKDNVFANFKAGKKAEAKDIPAATQIFTPNWIVKYMVQNTIGRIYLDNNPYEEDVQKNWKYIVEPAEKTPKENILHYDDLKELKFADLACGSGHILNEVFDILYDLYKAEGYSPKKAIENIFSHNLTGVDIDTRAKQLAQFALLLKACQKDDSFAGAHTMPHVLDMPEPYPHKDNMRDTLPHFFLGGNQEMIQEASDAIDLMDEAKNLGSIMKFNISERTRNAIMVRVEEYENEDFVPEEIQELLPYMRVCLALTEKYHALVMNPPYMGAGNMNGVLSKYVKDEYPRTKADLMSVFMDVATDRLCDNGKYGMINMHSWMFLSSFEQLRTHLIDSYHIDSLLHLGPRTFDELSGEVVQNASFVVSKQEANGRGGTYYRLVEGKNCTDKEQMFLEAITDHTERVYFEDVNQKNFEIISGFSISYWVSNKVIDYFRNSESQIFIATQGMATCDNNRFLREWYEVNKDTLYLSCSSIDDAKSSSKKWFPYNKGGEKRRWYGNQEFVVNWENDGKEIKAYATHLYKSYTRTIKNIGYYFKSCISWSDVTSGNNSFRIYPNGFIFDVTGMSCFVEEATIYNWLGLLNTNFYSMLAKIINPTLHFQVGDFRKLPFINVRKLPFTDIVKKNIAIAKEDWDAHETSWDFKENELVRLSKTNRVATAWGGDDPKNWRPLSLQTLVGVYHAEWEAQFNKLHENEEELNRQFIEIYGLEDELTPDVPLSEVTILQQGEITIEE